MTSGTYKGKMGSTIHCPSCRYEFELSAVMRAELEAEVRVAVAQQFEDQATAMRAAADARILEKETALIQARSRLALAESREADLLKHQRELAEKEQRLELDLQRRLTDETSRIREQEAKAAQERFSREAEERVWAKDQELAEAQSKLAAAALKEADLLRRQRELAEREQQLELDMERRLEEETRHIREREASAASERFSREADDRMRVKEQELAEVHAKLTAAASREAGLLRKERELADHERELAVETERRVAEETAKARDHEAKLGQQRAELQQEQQRLRDEEHRQTISGLEKTITDLQRKVQQGSLQLQGEAQEVVLRDLLGNAFPNDAVADVPKGVRGADLVQTVYGGDGRACGCIVWEIKRTRAWSDGWLAKVRDDQREAGAACAVIVTQALPPDVRHFGLEEGVWVCAPSYAIPLGAALRTGLVEVAAAKRAAEGSGQKMQLLYNYMTGTEFRNRVEGLVEAFVEMQEELASERRTTLTRWKRREKTIDRALDNITALCGDLQGISGRQLKDLLPEALDSAQALPAHDEDQESGTRSDDGRLKYLLLDLLPDDGSTVSNVSLKDLFVARAFTELGLHVASDDYERCKEALLDDGCIRRGKGRGGSIGRVVASAAE